MLSSELCASSLEDTSTEILKRHATPESDALQNDLPTCGNGVLDPGEEARIEPLPSDARAVACATSTPGRTLNLATRASYASERTFWLWVVLEGRGLP